jgi:hypothetical protein
MLLPHKDEGDCLGTSEWSCYPPRPRSSDEFAHHLMHAERSLSRPRACERGGSVRIPRDYNERVKVKEMSELDWEERERGKCR